jgi:hypothetical protein
MSERIHELLLRNLLEVFGEGDSAKRRSAIEELYTDDCVVYVLPGILVGSTLHPDYEQQPFWLRRLSRCLRSASILLQPCIQGC